MHIPEEEIHYHTHADGTVHAHTHAHTHTQTKSVINRLSRAIGHLESVKRMVESGRDCSEVLMQLAAVRSALNNTAKVILKDHLEHCIADAAGVRVHVPSSSESAGRGAAVLAGTAAGAWTKEAFPKDTGWNVYFPSNALQDCYRRYREIERRLWTREAVCSTS